MKDRKTTTVHVNVPSDILELFDKAFPSCRSRFVNNALRLATSDRALFDRIFFCDIVENATIRID